MRSRRARQRPGRIRRGQDGVGGINRGTGSGIRTQRLPGLPRPVGIAGSSTVSDSFIVRSLRQAQAYGRRRDRENHVFVVNRPRAASTVPISSNSVPENPAIVILRHDTWMIGFPGQRILRASSTTPASPPPEVVNARPPAQCAERTRPRRCVRGPRFRCDVRSARTAPPASTTGAKGMFSLFWTSMSYARLHPHEGPLHPFCRKSSPHKRPPRADIEIALNSMRS